SLRPSATRPRPTIARLMTRVFIAAVLFAMVSGLIRQWPFRNWLGGGVNLGIVLVLFFLPILPALLIWQRNLSRHRRENHRRAVILHVLCYLGWLGAIVVTFRSILGSLGL